MRHLCNTGAVAAYGRSRNRVLHEAFDGFPKSAHPAGTAVLAVADNVKTDLSLHGENVDDRPILNLSEFIWTDPALIMRGPRPQQFRGPQQAADVIDAVCFGHGG